MRRIADRSRHGARANDAAVFSTGQSSIGSAQNAAPEQHESLGNVATGCHFVPRKKHVAEIRKPNSPLHLRKEFPPRQGPGQHAQKTHTVYSRMYSIQESLNSVAPPNSIAAALSIERSTGWPSANLVRPSDCRARQEPRRQSRSA